MSGVLGVVVPSKFDSANMISFIAANGTVAKILIDKTQAVPLPASGPQFYGGATVFDMVASSTDTADKDLKLYVGSIKTTQETTATGNVTTTTGSVVRVNGSWIAEGLDVGSLFMIFAPAGSTPNAVDGILCTVTAVTATTLTLNGTPLSAMTLAAGSRIVKVSLVTTVKVPLGAGNSNSVPSVSLLANNSGSLVTNERKLGASDLIIIAMASAVSALPAVVSISGQAAYY